MRLTTGYVFKGQPNKRAIDDEKPTRVGHLGQLSLSIITRPVVKCDLPETYRNIRDKWYPVRNPTVGLAKVDAVSFKWKPAVRGKNKQQPTRLEYAIHLTESLPIIRNVLEYLVEEGVIPGAGRKMYRLQVSACDSIPKGHLRMGLLNLLHLKFDSVGVEAESLDESQHILASSAPTV